MDDETSQGLRVFETQIAPVPLEDFVTQGETYRLLMVNSDYMING